MGVAVGAGDLAGVGVGVVAAEVGAVAIAGLAHSRFLSVLLPPRLRFRDHVLAQDEQPRKGIEQLDAVVAVSVPERLDERGCEGTCRLLVLMQGIEVALRHRTQVQVHGHLCVWHIAKLLFSHV